MRRFLIAAALLAVGTPAAAAESAATLFTQGRFAEAIKVGTGEGTPAGLIAAGRSRLQIAAYDTTDKAKAKAMVEAAIGDFSAALAKDPANREAALQQAIANGYVAKLERSAGGAKVMKRSLEALLAKYPDDAQAWTALGAWHGGSIATLGTFIARTVIGATTDGMNKAFARAMALAPNDGVNLTFYALTLMDIDAGNADRAKTLLQRAAQLKPDDAFERQVQGSGTKVLAAINAGDAKAAQRLAHQLLPFGTVR